MKYKIKGTDEFLEIKPDEYPDDPRNWDNVGTMVCFHGRYTLGDKHKLSAGDFSGWAEIQKQLIREGAAVILPLYLYDHSGLYMKVGSFRGLLPQGHAEFDSGQVGFIYCSKDTLKKEGLTAARAEKNLRAEVETYAQFLSGDVWSFRKYRLKTCKECGDTKEETIESCGGFYGSNCKESGLYDYADVKEEQLEQTGGED